MHKKVYRLKQLTGKKNSGNYVNARIRFKHQSVSKDYPCPFSYKPFQFKVRQALNFFFLIISSLKKEPIASFLHMVTKIVVTQSLAILSSFSLTYFDRTIPSQKLEFDHICHIKKSPCLLNVDNINFKLFITY